MVPFEVAFDPTFEYTAEVVETLSWIVDLVFMADLIISLHFLGYIEDDVLVLDRKRTRRRYLATWFPFDAAGTLGVVVEKASGGNHWLTLARGTRALKLMRMLRLFRAVKWSAKWSIFAECEPHVKCLKVRGGGAWW